MDGEKTVSHSSSESTVTDTAVAGRRGGARRSPFQAIMDREERSRRRK